jgi:hypothetical protein
MNRMGLLLTLTEPPPAMEQEFNAWYDLEHLPERLSIPGFRSARRWVADCRPGEGKYLATYELDSITVLSSSQYLSFFEKPTPWTKRCLDATVVFKRWACEQLGETDPHPIAQALLVAFEDKEFKGQSLQVRRFQAASGETIALHELADPVPDAYRLYQP